MASSAVKINVYDHVKKLFFIIISFIWLKGAPMVDHESRRSMYRFEQ